MKIIIKKCCHFYIYKKGNKVWWKFPNSRFEYDHHFSKVAVKMTIDKEKLSSAGYLKKWKCVDGKFS